MSNGRSHEWTEAAAIQQLIRDLEKAALQRYMTDPREFKRIEGTILLATQALT